MTFACAPLRQVEEAAFAADGDFFFTRSPGGGRASLWSIKPEVHLVQVRCFTQVEEKSPSRSKRLLLGWGILPLT